MTLRLPPKRLRSVRAAILKAPRYPRNEREWIGNGLERLSKKRANKFLFACILDYQMKTELLWSRCRDFIEEDLDDPDCLWDVIVETPLSTWLKRMRDFGVHRFKDMAHR